MKGNVPPSPSSIGSLHSQTFGMIDSPGIGLHPLQWTFRLKDFRPTFCQTAIDNSASLSAVSKVMGHSTTSTTEMYYGRIGDKTTINEVIAAFSKAALFREIPNGWDERSRNRHVPFFHILWLTLESCNMALIQIYFTIEYFHVVSPFWFFE